MAKAIAKGDDKAPKKRRTIKKDGEDEQPIEAQQPVQAEQKPQPQPAQQAVAVAQPVKEPEKTVVTNGQNGETAVNGDKKNEFESTHAKYERIKRGNLHITDLQKMAVAELHEVCKREGVVEYTGMKKQELIFKILKERIQQNGDRKSVV